MSRRCKVCASPPDLLGMINAMLASGTKLKDIAAQVAGISPYSLSRHRNNCLAQPSITDVDSDSLERQAQEWAQRSADLYHASQASLDLRSQASAIAGGVRTLEVRLRHREKLQEEPVRELPDDCHQWTEEQAAQFRDYIDHVIAKAEQMPQAEDLFAVKQAERKAPDLHEIFVKLQENPDWKRLVKEFCAKLFMEKPGANGNETIYQQASAN
jgi:hypothetical protein